MRLLFLLLAAATCGSVAAAQSYPGTPISVVSGGLRCGARMFSATQVQTWCYTGTSPNWVLAHNTITAVTPGNAAVVGFVAGSDQILWIVSNVSDGQVRYQYSINGRTPGNGIFAGLSLPSPILARACWLQTGGSPWQVGFSGLDVLMVAAHTEPCAAGQIPLL